MNLSFQGRGEGIFHAGVCNMRPIYDVCQVDLFLTTAHDAGREGSYLHYEE